MIIKTIMLNSFDYHDINYEGTYVAIECSIEYCLFSFHVVVLLA